MRMNRIAYFSAIAAIIIVAACTILSVKVEAKTSPAENTIRAAAKLHRYVFVTFYKNNDSASKEMLADMKLVQKKFANRANFVSVNVGDKTNRGVISRYGADSSPIPLTIVVAPNGAITAGFPRKIKKSSLSDVFVSNGTAAVLKVVQNRKIAVVCLENSRTKYNKQCLATALSVKSDSRFKGAVEIVKINPSDRSELKLLKQLKANANSINAQLVVVAPPGRVVGKFDGATAKSSVMTSLMKSLSGGCGGGSCGPNGCSK